MTSARHFTALPKTDIPVFYSKSYNILHASQRPPTGLTSLFLLQISREKNYVIAQGGITLNALHAALAEHNLAMINVGSISDQTLAGVVTTATHGTGMDFKVISTHVLSLTLLLADGSKVRCSRQDRPDLFTASLCSLGSTGLILQIQLEVGPAFRLKETQESLPFDHVVQNLHSIAHASEHVRLWWFPQADTVRVSSADRANDVSVLFHVPFPRRSHRVDRFRLKLFASDFCITILDSQTKNPAGTFLWHSLFGYHLIQLLFFLGRYLPSINPWICRLSVWMDRSKTITVDDSWRVFNVDCKVRVPVLSSIELPILMMLHRLTC